MNVITGVALVMVICVYVTMMLFSGFLIDLQSVAGFLRWLQWLSVFRYASNVLAINEFRNSSLCSLPGSLICLVRGEEILERRHIAHATDWDLWTNIGALAAIAVVSFLLTFIQLSRVARVR
jgi:ATP-binding cassette, subfamily G (WHITE), member 2